MLGAARLIDVPERLSAKVFYCPEILLRLRTDNVILIHCDKVKCKNQTSRHQKKRQVTVIHAFQSEKQER